MGGMNQLELCERIARKAHEGQWRRDQVTPYIDHVEAVVSRCRGMEEKCVAWLHDVAEDTDLQIHDLERMGVDNLTCQHVNSLTKVKGETYEGFIKYISDCSEITRNVKIADILSNLADDPTPKQIVKYAKALLVLVNETN